MGVFWKNINAIFKKVIDDLSNSKKYEENFNNYYTAITNKSKGIVSIERDSVNKNYMLEISYICLLCLAFSRHLNESFKLNYDYRTILKIIDTEEMYCWYELPGDIQKEFLFYLGKKNDFNIETFIEFYEFALDSNEKKIMGQFYTPVSIVRTIMKEINLNKVDLSKEIRIIDPACGAGIFLVEIVSKLKKRGLIGLELASFVYNSLFGNDINPFAVILTKLSLAFELLSTINDANYANEFINKYLCFENIKFRNTVTHMDDKLYDFIIGNPPYFKIKDRKFENSQIYDEIIFGQPNIYAIYIYWAILHCVKNGKVSFIVPQSFRTGLYFRELRRKLYNLNIISIIDFKSRKKIFKDVEQAVLILTFKNSNKKISKVKIAHVEELDVKNADTYSISSKNIMFNEKYDFFFFVPRQIGMHEVLEKVYSDSFNLKSTNDKLSFGNGLFVWNQNKDYLTEDNIDSARVIYSSSINGYNFDYKINYDSKKEKKSYCKINNETDKFLLSGERLIIQRTSTFERVRRIQACTISHDFLIKNPCYFLENHVNYMYNKNNENKMVESDTMYFFLALLNSTLLNYTFTCKSGNTQVSATELNLLPIKEKNKPEIIKLSILYEQNKRDNLYKELDEIIFDNYDLNQKEIDIINRFKR